ncbi:MAG: ABC transporter permease [Conexibacteraceae bacterium]|nr:ABC transporter permease [Conexibacteraceae bacterium]
MGAFDLPLPELAERTERSGANTATAADAGDAPSVAGLAPPKLVHPKSRRRSIDLALRALGPLALVFIWWYAGYAHWVSPQVLAGPGAVWSAFWKLLTNGQLWYNLSASLKLAFTGLLIGGTAGLVLGLTTGLTKLGDELIDPLFQMMRTVPFIALSPLLILWFGIGDGPKVLLIAVAASHPLYLNSHSGVQNVDRKVLEAARVYGVSRLRMISEIVLPEALPSLMVGLRQALTISLLGLIFAEQINSTRGIGYLLTSAESDFQTNVMFVCIALYALWGLSADMLVRFLQWALMPWRHASRTAKTSAG